MTPNRLTREEAVAQCQKWDALANQIAIKWHRRHRQLDHEDILQEVRVGFWIATTMFDTTRRVQFSTYAAYWGENKARQFCQDFHGGVIKVPKHKGFVGKGQLSLDRPTVSREGVIGCLKEKLVEKIQEQKFHAPADFWNRLELVLTDKQCRVIVLRYREGWNLREIGTLLMLSRERVRQIEANALRTLVDFPDLFDEVEVA